jgi:hypothetical protein
MLSILLQANSRYYYSEVRKKVATESVVTIEGWGNVTVETLADFNEGKSYTVTNGRCKETDIPKIFQKNCVPSKADYLGAIRIGSPSISLTTSNYRFKVTNPSGDSLYVESMKFPFEGNCYDVATSTITESSRGVVKSAYDMVLGNFKTYISDRSVFNVPTECTRPLQMDMEDVFDETAFDFVKYII